LGEGSWERALCSTGNHTRPSPPPSPANTTSQQEALVWQTPKTKLTTHQARLDDSTEIRLNPTDHSVLRTFVDLGADAGAVRVNEMPDAPVITELLCYDQLLSPEQRQLTESYLAIKHGLTLNQTLPTNYLAPGPGGKAYPVWTATAEREFRHRIIGLAQDPAAGLERTEGFSVLAPDLLHLSWAQAPDSTAYLLIADDGKPTARNPYDDHTEGYITLQRKWRVQASAEAAPATLSFNPQQLFSRAQPGERWVLQVRRISTLIHPESSSDLQLIDPVPNTNGRLTFQLPPATSHFQLALRCSDCEVAQPPSENTFFRFTQLSPNPVQAGQPSQLRIALANESALLITAFDALGREVFSQALPPNTHHLTELSFPIPGTYSLHLRPRLKKRSAPQRTLKVVVH